MIRCMLSNPSDSAVGDAGLIMSDHLDISEAFLVEEMGRLECTHVAKYLDATWTDPGALFWEAGLVDGRLV